MVTSKYFILFIRTLSLPTLVKQNCQLHRNYWKPLKLCRKLSYRVGLLDFTFSFNTSFVKSRRKWSAGLQFEPIPTIFVSRKLRKGFWLGNHFRNLKQFLRGFLLHVVLRSLVFTCLLELDSNKGRCIYWMVIVWRHAIDRAEHHQISNTVFFLISTSKKRNSSEI